MIILFEENEVLFNGLGLGILKDAKSCQVVEELNDALELEMVYPYNGLLYKQLKIDRIIYCKPNPYDEAEPFRIYSISKPIKDYVTVKAQHISYDMNGIPVKPISGNGLRDTVDKIQNGSIIEHNFKIYTEKSSGKTFKTTNIYNMRAILLGGDESLLSVYDLEVKFNKFNVYLSEKRGANRGATITYAKNLKDITHEINYERLYNGVYPFYHQETTETKTDSVEGEFKQVYIVGTKPFQDGWLSFTDGGEPYHPIDEAPVQIATEGDYYKKVYCWNTTLQRYQEKLYDQTFTLIDNVSGLLDQNSETPQWVTIDWQSLTSLQLVLKAGEDGYFKMSTENEWAYYKKGEVVYQGSIKDFANALLIHYSEVIPEVSDSTIEETTNVTHVELDDKIIWVDTELAKSMKVNRILTLDLTSEFDDVPDKDALETKAKEYIEKNKIGQYKFDTSVSFVDLTSTTEGFKYSHLNHIELGDVVRVTYSSVGIDVDLRVITTSYDALNDKYVNIGLGEKPDKLSGSSVQNGDNISSLTNDVGYTDITTVNKLVAKIVTADFIKAKNAELSKAQIEQLEASRLKITGLIEATQFELDNLVAKFLTADNAVVKQTLEAGTIKVKGDISITSGMITIENTEDGTSFKVDRRGNVTANSLKITGGSIRIQDTFEVTNDGFLTAISAKIEGEIIAKSGEIAGFEIVDDYIKSGRDDYGDYIKLSPNGIYLGAYNSITEHRSFEVSKNGSMYSVSGQIGNFYITDKFLSNYTTIDGTSYQVLLSARHIIQNKPWFIAAGPTQDPYTGRLTSILFGVTSDGELYAEQATIKGDITADTGKIGDFEIQNGHIVYTSGSGQNAKQVYVGPDKIALGPTGNESFVADINGNVSIKNNFKLLPGGYLATRDGYMPVSISFPDYLMIDYYKTNYKPPAPFDVTDGYYHFRIDGDPTAYVYTDNGSEITITQVYVGMDGPMPNINEYRYDIKVIINKSTGDITYEGTFYRTSGGYVFAYITDYTYAGTWSANVSTSRSVNYNTYYKCTLAGNYNPDGTNTGITYAYNNIALYRAGRWIKYASESAIVKDPNYTQMIRDTHIETEYKPIGGFRLYQDSFRANNMRYRYDGTIVEDIYIDINVGDAITQSGVGAFIKVANPISSSLKQVIITADGVTIGRTKLNEDKLIALLNLLHNN